MIFTGKVPYEEVSDYIRTANIGILPFPNITWWAVSSPIKLMEYLAIGLPVVATDIDAHRWVVDKTQGAILADNDEPVSLAESIECILRTGLQQASTTTLESTISWNKQAKSLIEFTETLF